MAGWETKTLGELCEFQRGLTYGKSDEVDVSKNVVLRANNVDLATHTLDLSDLRYISDSVSVPETKKVRRGALLICTASGSKSHLGKIAYVDDDYGYAFGGFMGQITPAPSVNDRYLFHALTSPAYKAFIETLSDGVNINNLKFDDLRRFLVPVPNLDEQRRIVAILDEAFEAIATAKANAEKNLLNARELFDSKLHVLLSHNVGSWPRKTLREVSIDFGRGKSKHRPRNDPKLYGGLYPFIQTGDVRGAEHLITEYSQTYSEAGLSQSKLWPKGTLCITIAANIAETGVLDFDACFPDSIIGVVVDEVQTSSKYLEYMLHTVKASLKAKGKGSAQDNINLATFENERFPFPHVEVQTKIVSQLDDLADQVHGLEEVSLRKLAALDELKKSLLHQAFTGQLTSSKPMPVGQQAALQTMTPQFSANVIALAYARHERQKRDKTFGRIKEQKLLHLVEAIAKVDLGRRPIKDAAGPYDSAQMRKTEAWAKDCKFFEMVERDGRYDFKKLEDFEAHLAKAADALGPHLGKIEDIISLLLPMRSKEAEVFATVHAAWNNLLIDGTEVTDCRILLEARERWHPDKLKIPEHKFTDALKLIRSKGLIPDGTGKYVGGQQQLV